MAADLSPERILALGFGYWDSKALLSAVELALFSALADAPTDAGSLAARLGIDARGARDFFDALVALGVLERKDGVYRNTPSSDLYLDRNKPSYLGGFFEMASVRGYPLWGSLTEALKSGKPQSEAALGDSFYDALYADRQRLGGFMRAMSGLSRPSAQALATRFPWKDYSTFVDVGCAEGQCAVTIAAAHPHLTGWGFDLPQVGPIFDETVAGQGLGGRLKFVAGDFFAGVLPDADAFVMGHVLHNWDLAQKRELVAKAFAALPEGGALVAYDAMIDEERRDNTFALLMSLNMLINTSGGFGYTASECMGWMREAGFQNTRAEPLVGSDTMVVGIK